MGTISDNPPRNHAIQASRQLRNLSSVIDKLDLYRSVEAILIEGITWGAIYPDDSRLIRGVASLNEQGCGIEAKG